MGACAVIAASAYYQLKKYKKGHDLLEQTCRIIEIKEREQYRVKLFMDLLGQKEKTLVFCATQEHALAVRLRVAGIAPDTARRLGEDLANLALDGYEGGERVADSASRH